eukprot:6066366-Prymnesium_polylepis.2
MAISEKWRSYFGNCSRTADATSCRVSQYGSGCSGVCPEGRVRTKCQFEHRERHDALKRGSKGDRSRFEAQSRTNLREDHNRKELRPGRQIHLVKLR